MVYLAIAVICAVIALEVGLRIGQYNYVSRKEIDQIRAMRGGNGYSKKAKTGRKTSILG